MGLIFYDIGFVVLCLHFFLTHVNGLSICLSICLINGSLASMSFLSICVYMYKSGLRTRVYAGFIFNSAAGT